MERSAGGVVFRRRGSGPEFLVLRNLRGYWGFPKGHLNDGEAEEAAALREVIEETGLRNLRVIPNFKYRIRYRFKGEGGAVSTKEVTFYLMECTGGCGRVVISSEHSGFEWLPFPEAYRRISYGNARGVLAAAYARLLVPYGLVRERSARGPGTRASAESRSLRKPATSDITLTDCAIPIPATLRMASGLTSTTTSFVPELSSLSASEAR
ncbi:MAG: NUDIX domain-containing protein [Nitrososphaeria archaeon]